MGRESRVRRPVAGTRYDECRFRDSPATVSVLVDPDSLMGQDYHPLICWDEEDEKDALAVLERWSSSGWIFCFALYSQMEARFQD